MRDGSKLYAHAEPGAQRVPSVMPIVRGRMQVVVYEMGVEEKEVKFGTLYRRSISTIMIGELDEVR